MKRLDVAKGAKPDASTIANSLVTVHYRGQPPDEGSAYYDPNAPDGEPCELWLHVPVEPSNTHQSLRSTKVSHPVGTNPAKHATFSGCLGAALTVKMRKQSYADGLSILNAQTEADLSKALKAAVASQASWLQSKGCQVQVSTDGSVTVEKKHLREHLLHNCIKMVEDGEVYEGFADQVKTTLEDCTEKIELHAARGEFTFTPFHARGILYQLSRDIFDEFNTRTSEEEAFEALLNSVPLTDFDDELDPSNAPTRRGKHGINPNAYFAWASRHRIDATYLVDPDAAFTKLEGTSGRLMITITPRSQEELAANEQLVHDGLSAKIALDTLKRGEVISQEQMAALSKFRDYVGVQMDASFFLPSARPFRRNDGDTDTGEGTSNTVKDAAEPISQSDDSAGSTATAS
jgi:hypothetical protein